jgi:hypothetical protein
MKKIIVTIVLIACVIVSAFLHVYYIRDGASGDLLSNGEEAYLFLSVGTRGYRLSYLQSPIEYLRAYFRTGVSASEEHFSVFAIRITSDDIQRYEPQPLSLGAIDPVDSNIYARSNGALVKWSGAQFEPASTEELRRFQLRHISGPDFTNVDGWSKRCCLMSRAPEVEFEFQIGGKPLILIVKQGERDSNITVSLKREGQVPEKIWYLDQTPRRVRRGEYERIFRN